jgi:hypothetical protein
VVQETVQEGLLEITRLKEENFKTSGRRLMMEGIPVSPETYPYLISGMAQKVLWVRQPREQLSVAFRYNESLDSLFPSIVEAVEKEGVKKEWGNVLPFTEGGVERALSHLLYYGIRPAEILYSDHGPQLTDKEVILSGDSQEVVNKVSKVPWLPPGYGVVVPENKAYLGSAIVLSEGCFAIVVHNPSRGMVVLRDLPEEEVKENEAIPKPQQRKKREL